MAGRSPRPDAFDLTTRMCKIGARLIGLVGLVLLTCGPAAAQELEPKAYSASPVGATFVVSSLARSSGSVVTDPSIPITDIDATINAAFFGVGTTFDMLGKLALVSVAVPYAWGDVSGRVFEEARTVTRSGLADTRVRLSVNLRGNDAMHLGEYVKAPRRAIVGTSVTVLVPTGEYDRTKLINLGNHRWGFKPEVGLAVPIGRWDIDAYAGVWLFTPNDDFFPGGLERTQDPILAVQAHVSYTFKPRLWLAVDSTWYSGGKSRVAGGDPSAAVNNSRLGATLSLPASRQQSLKIAFSNGVSVRTGTDFSTVAVGWQWLWFRQ
jgi:Putative MetA-pathway of phenol degradation